MAEKKRSPKREKHICIYVCNKEGKGVGTKLEIRTLDKNEEVVGTLIFHNNHNWQGCDTLQLVQKVYPWHMFTNALDK